MTTDTALIIRSDDTAALVPLHASEGGLGITEGEPGKYTVTHLGCGLMLWPLWQHQTRDLDAVRRALRVALDSGIDWTQSREALLAALDAETRRALCNRMRLAAYPPRRPRWHKGARHRRLKPYEAQSKRTALREAAYSGRDIMREMWRDLWPYHRRGEAWGVIPAVVRQPCTRFGVAHRQRIAPENTTAEAAALAAL